LQGATGDLRVGYVRLVLALIISRGVHRSARDPLRAGRREAWASPAGCRRLTLRPV